MNSKILLYSIISLTILLLITYFNFQKIEYMKKLNDIEITPPLYDKILGDSPLQTLSDFNKRFYSEIVELPTNIWAIGFDKSNIYLHNSNAENFENGNVFSVYKKINPKRQQLHFLVDFFKYWMKEIHPYLTKKYSKYYLVINISDGQMERHPYCTDNLEPKSFPKNYFRSFGEIGKISCKYVPILHKQKQIFTFSGLRNDPYAFYCPDPHMMFERENSSFYKKIDKNFIPWDERFEKCIFRGTMENGSPTHFTTLKTTKNPRKYLLEMKEKGKLDRIIDIGNDNISSVEMSKCKYILDIDGWSNSWGALRWKLYSGSVVLKHITPFRQWYYDELLPFVHYIPIKNDFSDLNEKIEWCRQNQKLCKEIGKNGRKFVKDKLNYKNITEVFRQRVLDFYDRETQHEF